MDNFFDASRKVITLITGLHVSKSTSAPDFMHIFQDSIPIHSPWARADNPLGPKLMSTGRLHHYGLISYNFFHDLIHVYSPGAGGIQPSGDKVLMSTETSCHFSQIIDDNSF